MSVSPAGAVIELLERHGGDRKPLSGTDALIVPNELRINGKPVYAAYDGPVTIQEVTVDGSSTTPFAVTVVLQCRVLMIGEPDTSEPYPYGDGRIRCATVRVPTGEREPYAIVNDEKVLLAGPVTLAEMSNGAEDPTVMEVVLPLLCRRLVVDDEPHATGGRVTVPGYRAGYEAADQALPVTRVS